MRPPNIRVPGLNRGVGIPGGTRGKLIGRLSARGPAQLLDAYALRQMGIARPSNNQLANEAGFTFSTDGIPAGNQFIGRGVWSRDIHFHNSDPNNAVSALSGATGTPSLRMLDDALVVLGTIQFTLPTVAVVVWASDPYIHTAGQGLNLFAPTPADATLGRISGRVVGYL